MRQKKAKITRELYFAKTLIDSKSPPANNQGLVRAGGEGSPGWKQPPEKSRHEGSRSRKLSGKIRFPPKRLRARLRVSGL